MTQTTETTPLFRLDLAAGVLSVACWEWDSRQGTIFGHPVALAVNGEEPGFALSFANGWAFTMVLDEAVSPQPGVYEGTGTGAILPTGRVLVPVEDAPDIPRDDLLRLLRAVPTWSPPEQLDETIRPCVSKE